MHSQDFFNEVETIAANINCNKIENIVDKLWDIRNNGGRVFVLGVGGSAANASHMVNDLRKLCHIEAYCPTDNVSEITARTNDEGFDTIFTEYLKISRFTGRDGLFILSVGGGSVEKRVSMGLVNAMKMAQQNHVLGIVGRDDGAAAQYHNVIVVPQVNASRITPHSEAFQAVIWHCIVSHPNLQMQSTKW